MVGAAAIAGERERGTLSLLLASPVNRLAIAPAKALACTLYLAMLMAGSLPVAATALLAAFSGLSVEKIVGRGTGIDDATLAHKVAVIKRALDVNPPANKSAEQILASLGGFEIAGLAGVVLGAAARGMPVVLDEARVQTPRAERAIFWQALLLGTAAGEDQTQVRLAGGPVRGRPAGRAAPGRSLCCRSPFSHRWGRRQASGRLRRGRHVLGGRRHGPAPGRSHRAAHRFHAS